MYCYKKAVLSKCFAHFVIKFVCDLLKHSAAVSTEPSLQPLFAPSHLPTQILVHALILKRLAFWVIKCRVSYVKELNIHCKDKVAMCNVWILLATIETSFKVIDHLIVAKDKFNAVTYSII